MTTARKVTPSNDPVECVDQPLSSPPPTVTNVWCFQISKADFFMFLIHHQYLQAYMPSLEFIYRLICHFKDNLILLIWNFSDNICSTKLSANSDSDSDSYVLSWVEPAEPSKQGRANRAQPSQTSWARRAKPDEPSRSS